MAAQQFDIPPGLLAAIGVTESGRRNPSDGSIRPWPWSANAEGRSLLYSTQAEAMAGVRSLQDQGVRSIDVGCMQINLLYHPDAFASLEAAFDPMINALYAARFLRELFARAGNWSRAAELYHSSTAELGAPYRRAVMTSWLGQQGGTYGSRLSETARAWAATLATGCVGLWQGTALPANHGKPAEVPCGAVVKAGMPSGWRSRSSLRF